LLFERVELGHGFAEDVDDFVDLGAVEAKLGVAIGEGVDGFVLFQPFALEAEPFAQLFDLADEDEVEVFLAEVALALRTVNGSVFGILNELEDKLSLALRTLENLGKHAFILARRLSHEIPPCLSADAGMRMLTEAFSAV
jgi:hypothetical protein